MFRNKLNFKFFFDIVILHGELKSFWYDAEKNDQCCFLKCYTYQILCHEYRKEEIALTSNFKMRIVGKFIKTNLEQKTKVPELQIFKMENL